MKSENLILRNAHPQKERRRESSTKRESFQWKCRRLPLELAEDRFLHQRRILVLDFFLVAGERERIAGARNRWSTKTLAFEFFVSRVRVRDFRFWLLSGFLDIYAIFKDYLKIQ